MAIYAHSYGFNEEVVRHAFDNLSHTGDINHELLLLASATHKSASRQIDSTLRAIGFDEDWLSPQEGAWRIEESILIVMAPYLEPFALLESNVIGTLMVTLTEAGWSYGDIRILLEGSCSLDLLLRKDSNAALATAGAPVSSRKWTCASDIREIQERLEESRYLFLKPSSNLISLLSVPSPKGWQHGWNIAPRVCLEETWNVIQSRLVYASQKQMALLQWSDAPLPRRES